MPRVVVLLGLAALALAAVVPAGAQSPQPRCGIAFTDPAGDHNGAAGDLDSGDVNLDILEGWFDYDPAKGDKGLTANIRLAELSTRMPAGGSGAVWNVVWEAGGATRFVRAIVDFSGGPYYEYGSFDGSLPLGRYVYEGTTEGSMTEGKNGVLSIVVPAAAGGSPGTSLQTPFATAALSRQVIPGSVPAPTRGLSSVVDTAPDGGAPGTGGTSFAVAPCAPPAAAPLPKAAAGAGAAAKLPVRLLTSSVKRAAKGKRVTLRLRASEPVSRLGAQLRRGKAVYAKGTRARLDGAGTLALKLSRKLTPGRYTLRLTGRTAGGTRSSTATVRVR